MKFRKKPVVVEAVQFDKNALRGDWPDGICSACQGFTPHVHVNAGREPVADGDWIVTDLEGRRYPLSPQEFEALHDKLSPAEAEE